MPRKNQFSSSPEYEAASAAMNADILANITNSGQWLSEVARKHGVTRRSIFTRREKLIAEAEGNGKNKEVLVERTCLMCRAKFQSTGPGNRRCEKCTEHVRDNNPVQYYVTSLSDAD